MEWNIKADRTELILALRDAIVETFDRGDWSEIGLLTGEEEYIETHRRLLRSLEWGDSDYAACVLDTVRYLIDNKPKNLNLLLSNRKIAKAIEKNHPEMKLSGSSRGGVPVPSVHRTDLARQAIQEAETLIEKHSAASGVDRMHTALHAYLEAVCDEAEIEFKENSSTDFLLGELRRSHPSFQTSTSHEAEVAKIMKGIGKIVDALNPIRDNASLAHPNTLLEEPEAMAVVDAARTVIRYVEAKLQKGSRIRPRNRPPRNRGE